MRIGTTGSEDVDVVVVEAAERVLSVLVWVGRMPELMREPGFRFERAVAEVWEGSVEKDRGGRKGIATENLEERKSVK